MLRLAASRSQELGRLAAFGSSQAIRNACSKAGKSEASSVAELIKEVNAKPFSLEGLAAIKASTLAPHYPTCKPAGWSLEAKILVAAIAAITYHKASEQARSHEWIVDLSLDVLQSAWWISWFSFLPFRGIYVALRGLAPHTTAPITGFRTAVALKP